MFGLAVAAARQRDVGWRDPQNRLWRKKIIADGWTTNITLRDEAKRPTFALSTPPTAFTPTTTHANSLYECSNTNQLIKSYYACFNYPNVSSLTKAINPGYMKGWQGLTSQQVKHPIVISPESEMGHIVLRGFKPLLPKLDIETSHEVEAFICSRHTHLQYTPPDMHRTNPAERAIRTWKNHFLSRDGGAPKVLPHHQLVPTPHPM